MAALDAVPHEVMRSMQDPKWAERRTGETEAQHVERVARVANARRALAAHIAPPKDPKP